VHKRLGHLPVISEMLEMTTIFKRSMATGKVTARISPKYFILGVNCRFSSIVLHEFTTPLEGKPINAYGVLDEKHIEAGDRALEAPKLLCIQREE
jgi:hypothetical protein